MLSFTELFQDQLSFFAFIGMILSLIAVVFLDKKIPFVLTLITVILSTIGQRIGLYGLLALAILTALLLLAKQSKQFFVQLLLYTLSLILMFSLVVHYIPGFDNWLVALNIQLSPNSTPYTLYLNFDKPLIALILALTLLKLNHPKPDPLKNIITIAPRLLFCISLVTLLSYMMGFVIYEPKWHPLFYLWCINNLLIVCFTEEIIFRGFIQNSLTQLLSKQRHGQYIALIIASILFGAIHFKGGLNYMILASIAGLFYGAAYMQTKRIESAIITHFSQNLLHFLLFTYPSLYYP